MQLPFKVTMYLICTTVNSTGAVEDDATPMPPKEGLMRQFWALTSYRAMCLSPSRGSIISWSLSRGGLFSPGRERIQLHQKVNHSDAQTNASNKNNKSSPSMMQETQIVDDGSRERTITSSMSVNKALTSR